MGAQGCAGKQNPAVEAGGRIVLRAPLGLKAALPLMHAGARTSQGDSGAARLHRPRKNAFYEAHGFSRAVNVLPARQGNCLVSGSG